MSVHLTLSGRQYDVLYQAARTLRRSVPELIRRAILRTENSDRRPS